MSPPANSSSEPVGESSPLNINAESYFKLRGCRIKRQQLDRVWQLAREGFPADSYISITTRRNVRGIESEIKGTTIEELLDGVARATLPGNPEVLEDISFWISANVGRQYVSISIRPDGDFAGGLRVTVKGNDPGWVRGRIDGLRDLFVEAQSPRWTGRGRMRFIGFYSALVVSNFVTFLVGSTTRHWPVAAGITLALGIPVIASGVAYLIGSWLDRRSRTQLLLAPAEPRLRLDWLNIAVLIVTILGVLATIAAIIVAHWDATHPH